MRRRRSVALLVEWALLEWRAVGDTAAAEELLRRAAALPAAQPNAPQVGVCTACVAAAG